MPPRWSWDDFDADYYKDSAPTELRQDAEGGKLQPRRLGQHQNPSPQHPPELSSRL
jgi:hypothetical protein